MFVNPFAQDRHPLLAADVGAFQHAAQPCRREREVTPPSDHSLKHAVVRLVAEQPDCCIEPADAYALLEAQFPELTSDETRVPYQTSRSHFANRVQWAVQHLRDEGWLAKGRVSGNGRWEFTAKARAGWRSAFPTAEDLIKEISQQSNVAEGRGFEPRRGC
jgi:hypothetical protein